MKFNRQRRKFLAMSNLVISGLYLQGCGYSPPPSTPAIITHPIDQSVTEGAVAVFNVIASGNLLRYQWQKNGTDIPGATDAFYTTLPITQGDEGAKFTVTVTNYIGSIKSNLATLAILSTPITVDSLAITIDSSVITTDRF